MSTVRRRTGAGRTNVAGHGGPAIWAALAAAETPCPSGGKLRVNDIVSSLAYCYRNGLLGC
jgi:hypothetical protein